ncbi:BQ5605_C020g09108 [Microbotryum silenes-dioicae]|uniref:BQ5605_C020g09108 protein n=1 Tax=Microbotryum silenes-dioicae TaxID=796604 RepID=A0A2X0MM89_9BASI|nr:BQ5605_C020g09108 [Microbotryum silenes-dioicae]
MDTTNIGRFSANNAPFAGVTAVWYALKSRPSLATRPPPRLRPWLQGRWRTGRH